MKVLVIGGSGFIGGRIVQIAAAQGHSVAYTYSRKPLSLANIPTYPVDFAEQYTGLIECIEEVRPDTIIYAAVPLPTASVEDSEIYAHHMAVSVDGVGLTAYYLRELNLSCRLIYISTNAVFGNGRSSHREDDLPDPHLRSQNDLYRAYALTKAEGEQVALTGWPDTIVARTSVVDGRLADGSLSYRIYGLVKGLQEGKTLVRFNDRFISPTLVDNLVEGLLEVSQPSFNYRGVLHLAGSERTTDYDYALALARHLGFPDYQVQANSLNDSPAMRDSPADSSLDVTFTQSLLQTRLLNVQEQLARLFPQKSL